MQIIRWPGAPRTVVKIRIRDEVFVAVPPHLPRENTLDLARLVLTGREFDEFTALVIRPSYGGRNRRAQIFGPPFG